MKITNRYCELKALTQTQIDKLRVLMPKSNCFDFMEKEELLGFTQHGTAGTFTIDPSDIIISYEQMVALITGEKEEEKLIPHVHQKEIIAWANGEEIEFLSILSGRWVQAFTPRFTEDTQYRVKPEITPTQLRIQELTEEIVKLREQHNVECGINKVMGS
jgi:hypothetical protein